MKALIFVLLGLLALVCAQNTGLTQFTAQVSVTLPSMNGRALGTFSYDQPGSRILIAYDFAGAANVVEFYDYRTVSQGQVRYIWCPNDCDADNLGSAMPNFVKQATDTNAGSVAVVDQTGKSRTCTKYTRSNDPVTSISYDNDGPCEVVLAVGTVYTFKSGAKTFNPNVFNGAPPSNCPAKSCGVKLDFYQVLDESGSIDGTEWSQLKTFSEQVVDGFRFDQTTGVGMGIVTFSSGNSITNSARVHISMSFSQSNVRNTVVNLRQQTGNTCIGCGAQVAIDDHYRSSLKRPTATKVALFCTDGANNEYNNLMSDFPIWQGAGNPGDNPYYRNWVMFAIGIGSTRDLDEDQLLIVAGDVSRRIITPDFTSLQKLVNQIVTQTCVLTTTFSCPNCLGFCVPVGCNGPCICPDCDDNNPCTLDSCKDAALGCVYSPNPCTDPDQCTYDTCTPSIGCQHTPKVPLYGDCVDVGVGGVEGKDNLCTTDGCRSDSGCFHDQIQCDDGNVCTTDSCDINTGCVFTPIAGCKKNCNQTGIAVDCSAVQAANLCERIECDPSIDVLPQNYPDPGTQCTSKGPKVCDDNNPCTVDTCEDSTGNCIYTPVNETIFCTDNDFCTWDVCDPSGQRTGLGPGCHNIPVDCNDGDSCSDDACDSTKALYWDTSKVTWTGCNYKKTNCSDGNICTDDWCDHQKGCYTTLKDCSKDPVLHDIIGSCYQAFCDPAVTADINTTLFINQGCYLSQIVNTTVNKCGKCCGLDLKEQDLKDCIAGGGCATGSTQDNTLAVGGLFLAAILIAIIAICIVIGLLAGKKGYDIYLKNKGVMTGANTSPLYTSEGLTGTNALYEQPAH